MHKVNFEGAAQTASSYYVLLHPDPARFVAWRSELETFLPERLNFKPKKLADQRAYFATPHLRMRVLMQVGKHWTLAGICPGGQPTQCFVYRPSFGFCTERPLHTPPVLRRALNASCVVHLIANQSGHFKIDLKTPHAALLVAGAAACQPLFVPTQSNPVESLSHERTV